MGVSAHRSKPAIDSGFVPGTAEPGLGRSLLLKTWLNLDLGERVRRLPHPWSWRDTRRVYTGGFNRSRQTFQLGSGERYLIVPG